jgi:hypothetical protein
MKNGVFANGSWILVALVAMASVGCAKASTSRPAATTAMTLPVVMDDATPVPPQPAARTASPSANDDGSVPGHPEQRWGRPDRSK